jgi:integrase/recombinase XerD
MLGQVYGFEAETSQHRIATQVLKFLDALESQRRNSVRSRNIRLAAIRSFLRYAALQDPTALASITRSLAIPTKRFDKIPVSYLFVKK